MLIKHFGKQYKYGYALRLSHAYYLIVISKKTLNFHYPILDPSFDMLDIKLEIMTLFHPDPIKINFKEDN